MNFLHGIFSGPVPRRNGNFANKQSVELSQVTANERGSEEPQRSALPRHPLKSLVLSILRARKVHQVLLAAVLFNLPKFCLGRSPYLLLLQVFHQPRPDAVVRHGHDCQE